MKEWGPKRLTDLFVQLGSHKTVEVKPEKTHSPPIPALYLTARNQDSEKPVEKSQETLEPGQTLDCAPSLFQPYSVTHLPQFKRS